MQPLTENTINVPAFLNKLWKMVNDPKTDHLISWGLNGTTFVIQNKAQFWYELLPLYYKHNNMSSFIRQLNMYGFHKIQGADTSESEKDELRFFHQYFQKSKPELLRSIKRKVTISQKVVETTSPKEQPISREEISKFLADITQLKGRQQTVDTQLSSMKQENAVLWRELALLRQKHLQQQKIVNKLIQFLVTLVQPSSRMGGLAPKRHYPLMISEKPTKKAKSSNSESGKSTTSDGPIIHELENTDFLQDELLAQAGGGESCEDNNDPFVQSPDFNRDMVVELLSDTDMQDDLPEDMTGMTTSTQSDEALDIDGKIFLNAHTQDTLLSNLMNGNYNTKSMNDVLLAGTAGPSKKEDESNTENKTVATRVRLSRLNSVEDMDLHVEKTQTEIESLKDILNPLLNGVQTVDANAFLGLFSDDLPSYGLSSGLSYNADDLPKTDQFVCGSELTTYGSNLDFSQLFDEDSSDDIPNSTMPTSDNLDEGGSITTPQIIPDAPLFPKAN